MPELHKHDDDADLTHEDYDEAADELQNMMEEEQELAAAQRKPEASADAVHAPVVLSQKAKANDVALFQVLTSSHTNNQGTFRAKTDNDKFEESEAVIRNLDPLGDKFRKLSH